MAATQSHSLSLIERTLKRFGYVKWRPASVIHRIETPELVAGGDLLPASDPAWGQSAQYAGVYAGSPWVYVAVNRIAEAAALVPFKVVTRAGAGEVGSPEAGEVAQPDHPFVRLLQRPNPLMSRFELLEATLGNLEIHGNAYWFLAGEPGGAPQELWPLRPDRVQIVPDPLRGVRGYVYTVDGREIPLDAAEVVHFRRWHPANDYYGLSALEAARLAVESDRAMADWNRRYFSEGYAVPAGIVALKDRVSDADFERIKREWRTSYGGRERRTAFLRGASVEWHNVGLSQNDMDFLNARRFNREEIFQIFGIPVGIFSENATEANALVGERVFIERTLWPKLVRIAEKLTTDLLPFFGSGLAGRFEDIRPQDRSTTFEELRLAKGVLTVDELRARYFGLGPLPPENTDHASGATSPPPDGDTSPAPGNNLPDAVTLAADSARALFADDDLPARPTHKSSEPDHVGEEAHDAAE